MGGGVHRAGVVPAAGMQHHEVRNRVATPAQAA